MGIIKLTELVLIDEWLETKQFTRHCIEKIYTRYIKSALNPENVFCLGLLWVKIRFQISSATNIWIFFI